MHACHAACRCKFIETGKVAMKLFIFSLALAASLAGCSTPPGSSSMGASASGATPQQVSACQVIRSYENRSAAGEYRAACDKQLGVDLCTRCLASGL
jgi:hypothetical protein